MPVIEVFTKPGCGWAERNYAVLEIKNLPYRLVPSCDRFGHKTPEFLSLSPYARTPTVRVDGHVIYESPIINEFFEDAFPEPQLRSVDPHQRAVDRLWIRHCDFELIPLLGGLMPGAEEVRRIHAGGALKRGLNQVADWGGQAKRGTPFWRGEEVGLVDLVYHTLFNALAHVNAHWPVPQVVLPETLQAWADRLARHPVILKARDVAGTAIFAPDLTPEEVS
jgi:glutathione S-transferase